MARVWVSGLVGMTVEGVLGELSLEALMVVIRRTKNT